jgi:hypothetical protein
MKIFGKRRGIVGARHAPLISLHYFIQSAVPKMNLDRVGIPLFNYRLHFYLFAKRPVEPRQIHRAVFLDVDARSRSGGWLRRFSRPR